MYSFNNETTNIINKRLNVCSKQNLDEFWAELLKQSFFCFRQEDSDLLAPSVGALVHFVVFQPPQLHLQDNHYLLKES